MVLTSADISNYGAYKLVSKRITGRTAYYLLQGLCKGPVIIYGRGGGKNKGGICINKLLEGGATKFFQENEGGCN